MAASNYGNLYWRIESGCNLNCFMCFRDHSSRVIKGYEKKLLEGARDLGFQTIVITGGEPTLRHDLAGIIHSVKSYGFNTRFETNGILVDRKFLSSIKNDLDLLGLPLHGSNPKLHDYIVKKKGHFEIIRQRAKTANELDISLKITTAVSRKNIDDIENIASYLSAEIHPAIYALNEIARMNMECDTYAENSLREGEFDSMKEKLLKKNLPFKLSLCSTKDSPNAYISVNPDFTISISRGNGEEKLGDLKAEDLEVILARANLDHGQHIERFIATNL